MKLTPEKIQTLLNKTRALTQRYIYQNVSCPWVLPGAWMAEEYIRRAIKVLKAHQHVEEAKTLEVEWHL